MFGPAVAGRTASRVHARDGVGLALRNRVLDPRDVLGVGQENPVLSAIGDTDFGQLVSPRTRKAFVETLRLAVLSTLTGAAVALPLALVATRAGAPNRVVLVVARSIANVVRALPDILWALLFVAAVGSGALPGLLALFLFTIAVVTKLTADTLDGIDIGPGRGRERQPARATSRCCGTARCPRSCRRTRPLCCTLRAQPALVGGPRLVGAGGIGAAPRELPAVPAVGPAVGDRRDVHRRGVRRRSAVDAPAPEARVTATTHRRGIGPRRARR